MKKSVSLKLVVILMAAVLVIGFTVGGTLSWLQSKTAPVKNTFTKGKVEITLTETTGAYYKMVPGTAASKDPKVTVIKGSESSYVFVKIEENLGSWSPKYSNFKNYISYTVADGWYALSGVSGVYYRLYTSNASANSVYQVLKGDSTHSSGMISYTNNITQTMMDELNESNPPYLQFTAYAIQQAGFSSPLAAWNALQ